MNFTHTNWVHVCNSSFDIEYSNERRKCSEEHLEHCAKDLNSKQMVVPVCNSIHNIVDSVTEEVMKERIVQMKIKRLVQK